MTLRRYHTTTVCDNCPFRTDIRPYLSCARKEEIVTAMRDGFPFHCHKTVYMKDGESETKDRKHCTGALIIMKKEGWWSEVMVLAIVLARLHGHPTFDESKLDMEAPVYSSFVDFIEDGDDRCQKEKRPQ